MFHKGLRRMRGKMIAGAAVAGIAGLVPAVTQGAILDYQLRISGAIGTDTAGSATKSATVSIGQVVTLDLYSVLTAADGTLTNDGFQRTNGSFSSSNGGLLGTLRGGDNGTSTSQVNNVTPFKGSTALAGRAIDLDGDTDLDVGSAVTSGSVSPFPWFEAISDTNTTAQFGTGAGNTLEQLIGQILFTVGSGGPDTSLNYIPRLSTSGTLVAQRMHNFTLDGVAYTVNGAGTGVKGGSTAVSGTISTGVPVVLALAPEPTSLGVLAVGAVALLRRRKA
jgi:hypothetical protein